MSVYPIFTQMGDLRGIIIIYSAWGGTVSTSAALRMPLHRMNVRVLYYVMIVLVSSRCFKQVLVIVTMVGTL